ncbi:putative protein transport protein Sec23A [Trypanosoma rangeli]|uniref:Uncharacterized protein n=1 Tax=Trypanosoma rangeli TaxID=5698 RepID=A0A422NE62_TRYRA|nr:putative protein transport protein Sec23A [Trypanosoma rangeli]RNF03777.1 putative protein transport protein Sec23A [Trypanosoma rangeli]|eukprot:RNF03777.1 putative protein transport protein Sec23A [Trypanosoma rangeli]
MAVDAARRYAAGQHEAGDSHAAEAVLWFDDTVVERRALEEHVRSPAYKELHRPALTNAAMGLYGGEPGFEKAHRVWVDPDRPHMKHLYNKTALAKNLRYARYGYFKRDMHILDIDKLIRHARMLPIPGRLLTDFLYQRVPLPDKSCAALIRFQCQQIEMLEEWQRHTSFQCAAEMFERLVVTNIPPVEVGVETHAEMVLCAAASGKWEEGWDIYVARAREMEVDSPDSFVLNTYFFDAVLTLCVAAARVEEGMSIMEEVITRNLRPRATILDKAMLLCAMGAERIAKGMGTDDGVEQQKKLEQCGLELWALYDFYQLPRTTVSIEAYMRMCCAFFQPTLVLKAQSFADAAGIRLSLECFHWLVYALREVADFGDYVMDVFSQLTPRGLTPDFVLFTMAFMHCALQRDGELALAIYDQHFIHANINPTPEMVLLFIQSCAHCEKPRVAMLERCEALLRRLEEVGSSVDYITPMYDQFLELCGQLGAVASGFSVLKKLVSLGKPLTTRMLNSLLLANAYATPPNGSLAMTEEIAQLFTLLKVPPNKDTHICLGYCTKAFGASSSLDAFSATVDAKIEMLDDTLAYDADIPVLQVPPNELRQLRTEWKLRPRDIMLRRFGQYTKFRGKDALDVGSMHGSVIPFGRTPGEQNV